MKEIDINGHKFKIYNSTELSNEDYHGEKYHLSSSNFKMLLKEPEKFYKEKILKESTEVPKSLQNAYDEGSAAHTLILEPHNFKSEYVIYDGLRKSGKDWEDFKSKYEGKPVTILSKPQKIRIDSWVESYENFSPAKNLIKNGVPELSLFSEVDGIPIKVRADWVNIEEGYIVDVKTTGSGSDFDSFKQTSQKLGYDLSASMYLNMFETCYDKRFEFFFVVLDKRNIVCDVYRLSDKTREEGIKNLNKAFDLYKKCKKTGIWVLNKEENDDIIEEENDYVIREI